MKYLLINTDYLLNFNSGIYILAELSGFLTGSNHYLTRYSGT